MTSSNEVGAASPSSFARGVENLAGQLPTMARIASSWTQSTRLLGFVFVARSSALSMSLGVVDRAGRFSAVRLPQVRSSAVMALTIPSIVRAGDDRAIGVDAGTGQVARCPASGSRMIPEMKLEAAALGLPGRTATVMSRRLRPRINPRRV